MTKRELIATGTDTLYVLRDQDGRFKESVDVSRSLSADARHDAKHDTKSGKGDKGRYVQAVINVIVVGYPHLPNGSIS